MISLTEIKDEHRSRENERVSSEIDEIALETLKEANLRYRSSSVLEKNMRDGRNKPQNRMRACIIFFSSGEYGRYDDTGSVSICCNVMRL